jgi:hypothetical protein
VDIGRLDSVQALLDVYNNDTTKLKAQSNQIEPPIRGGWFYLPISEAALESSILFTSTFTATASTFSAPELVHMMVLVYSSVTRRVVTPHSFLAGTRLY